MGRRYLILEDKHLFNQHWGDQWEVTGKDNKLCLREVTKARKCSKLSGDIETGGGVSIYRYRGCRDNPTYGNLSFWDSEPQYQSWRWHTNVDGCITCRAMGMDLIFLIHIYHTLCVKWVLACNEYWREEACTFNYIVLNYNHFVVIDSSISISHSAWTAMRLDEGVFPAISATPMVYLSLFLIIFSDTIASILWYSLLLFDILLFC